MSRKKSSTTPVSPPKPDDEFLGFVTEQPAGEEREEERRLRVGLMSSLIVQACRARNSQRGIKLEKMVLRLESYCIRLALQRCDGDVGRASIWLGYRTPDVLNYVLRRHPSIKARKTVKL